MRVHYPLIFNYTSKIICYLLDRLRRAVSVLVVFWITSTANASAINNEAPDIVTEFYVFESNESHLAYDDVVRSEQNWRLLMNGSFSAGLSKRTYWLKVIAEVDASETTHVVLIQDYPLLDTFNVYITENGRLVETSFLGDNKPISERKVSNQRFVVPIDMEPDARYVIYIQVSSSDAIDVSPRLIPDTDYDIDVLSTNIVNGFFYGLLIAMLLYNALLYWSIRDRVYLYYLGYVASMIWFFMNQLGDFYFWFIPGYPDIHHYCVSLSLYLVILLGFLFIIKFLRLRATLTHSYRVFIVLILIATTSQVFSFLGYYTESIAVVLLVVAIGGILGIVSAIYLTRLGDSSARLFVLGWLFLIGSIVTMVMIRFGVFYSDLISSYAMRVGASIESILFSLALGQKITIERKARVVAEESENRAKIETINARKEADAKTKFIIDLSNEVRSPLNRMLWSTALLSDGERFDQQRVALREIVQANEEIKDIMDTIIHDVKIESGSLFVYPMLCRLDNLLNEVISSLSSYFRKREVYAYIVIKPGTPDSIFIDPMLFKRVVVNLITNVLTNSVSSELCIQVGKVEVDKHSGGEVIEIKVYTDNSDWCSVVETQLNSGFHQNMRAYVKPDRNMSLSSKLITLMGGSLDLVNPETEKDNSYILLSFESALEPNQEYTETVEPTVPIYLFGPNNYWRMLLDSAYENDIYFVESEEVLTTLDGLGQIGKTSIIILSIKLHLNDSSLYEKIIKHAANYRNIHLYIQSSADISLLDSPYYSVLPNPISGQALVRLFQKDTLFMMSAWPNPAKRYDVKVAVLDSNPVSVSVIEKILIDKVEELHLYTEKSSFIQAVTERNGYLNILMIELSVDDVLRGGFTDEILRVRSLNGEAMIVAVINPSVHMDFDYLKSFGFDACVIKPYCTDDVVEVLQSSMLRFEIAKPL